MLGNPLDEFNDITLFRLLGEAWCSNLSTCDALLHHGSSRVDIGRREFNIVAPILIEALRQPYFHGTSARIASALKVEAIWPMPTPVIEALADRQGFILARNDRRQE